MTSLLTVHDVCVRLHLGRSSVYSMIKDGRLVHVRLGRQVRILEAELDRFIASRSVNVDES